MFASNIRRSERVDLKQGASQHLDIGKHYSPSLTFAWRVLLTPMASRSRGVNSLTEKAVGGGANNRVVVTA